MLDAIQHDLKAPVSFLWHKDSDLSNFTSEDCIILPGGFSYGDYLRCGAIARFSPMMQSVIRFANEGGKVFGVCNGFQILCESGLLPGVLLQNINRQFICKNVHIRSSDGRVFTIPIAHGEGRYHGNENLLDELEANQQVIFRYCDANGNLTNSANPNGSARHIAGICNKERNVFGMMPHPERATSSSLGNMDGLEVFRLLGLLPELIS